MIRLKGENVSAYEVESVINEHPCVSESAVIGIPTELGDEQIKAFIVLTEAQEQDIQAAADRYGAFLGLPVVLL